MNVIFFILISIFTRLYVNLDNNTFVVNYLKVLVCFIVLILLFLYTNLSFLEIEYGFFSLKSTFFVNIIKAFLLSLLFIFFFFIMDFFFHENFFLNNLFENIFFILSFFLGLFLLLSSSNFLVVFFSLEIVSFSLYYLVICKTITLYVVEAGIKYFVLSLISSSLILQGFILFYGFFGFVSFFEIFILSSFFSTSAVFFFVLNFSILLVFLGLFFKLTAAPFHFWSPDVYEAATFSTFLLLSVFSKFGYFVILLKFVLFFKLFYFYNFLFLFVSLFSMFIGILGSIFQIKLKRFLAYTSIFHIGLLIVGFFSFYIFSLSSFFFLFFFLRFKSVLFGYIFFVN